MVEAKNVYTPKVVVQGSSFTK